MGKTKGLEAPESKAMTPTKSVEVPLPDYILQAAREAARTVIAEHVKTCTAKQDIKALGEKVTTLRVRFAGLIGLMIGSGAIGGGVVAGIMKVVG